MKTCTKILSVLVACAAGFAQAATVTLGWNPSPDASVSGYRVYQGPASRSYTNSVSIGLVTSYTVQNLTVGSSYFFTVTCYTTNGLESGFSNEVGWTVPVSPPVITTAPVGSTNATGSTVIFSVVATGTGLTYQWTKNGVNLAGQTGSTLTLPSVTWMDNGMYDVRVSNAASTVVPAAVKLAVIPLPPTGLTVGP